LSLRMKNINDEDPQGYSPFVSYALSHNFDMASKLLSRGGGYLVLNYCNREGRTPISIAVKQVNE
jgi:hypothetical protein